MSQILAIARSGIMATSRALEVVADNVANAATPGHVRRTAALAAALPGGSQGPLEAVPIAGFGVRLESVGRAAAFLEMDTLRRLDGQAIGMDAARRWLGLAEQRLGSRDGIDASLTAVFSASQAMASAPADPALRRIFLGEASALADRFRETAAGLHDLLADLDVDAAQEARQLGQLATALAGINDQLRRAAAGSGPAAVLADERDRLLAQISGIIAIDVAIDGRGQADVRLGDAGGPLLVEGMRAQSVAVRPSATGLELLVGPHPSSQVAPLLGGALAGLAAARTAIGSALFALDALALRVASEFNAQHQAGADLDGNRGRPLFGISAPRLAAASANGGAARLTVAGEIAADSDGYRLTFDGSQWTLSRADLSDTATGPLPLTLDGLTIDGTGMAAPGDVWRLTPLSGARALSLLIDDPRTVAVAPAFLVEASGPPSAELRPTAPAAPEPAPYQLSLLAGGAVELRDANGNLMAAGLAGQWLAGPGFEVRAPATAAEGWSASILPAPPGTLADDNAVALAALARSGPPGARMSDDIDRLIAGLATRLADTRARGEAARAARAAAAEGLQAVAGVDLNQEAAEMLRLQQAFQANARVIQTARETFDTLLAAAR